MTLWCIRCSGFMPINLSIYVIPVIVTNTSRPDQNISKSYYYLTHWGLMSFRLLARTLERPPYILYRKYAFQAYSTIFSVSTRRPVDHKAFEDLKTTLLYVLHPFTSKEYGFGYRDDGYVSVKRLVSFPLSVRDASSSGLEYSLTTLNFNHWI